MMTDRRFSLSGAFLAVMKQPTNPMELTYKIRGADGKEYGPVNLEELTTWLRESRIGPENEVMRSDMNYWSQAGKFTELQ